MEFQKHMRPPAPKPWGPREGLWGTRISLWVFSPLYPPHDQSSYHRVQLTHLADGNKPQRVAEGPSASLVPTPFGLCAPSKGGLR